MSSALSIILMPFLKWVRLGQKRKWKIPLCFFQISRHQLPHALLSSSSLDPRLLVCFFTFSTWRDYLSIWSISPQTPVLWNGTQFPDFLLSFDSFPFKVLLMITVEKLKMNKIEKFQRAEFLHSWKPPVCNSWMHLNWVI